MAGQFPNQQPNYPPAAGGGLIGRIQRLIARPAAEWPLIDADPAPAAVTFTKIAVPFAAIGPIATFLKGQLFGWGAFGFSYKPGLTWSIFQAIESYAVALAAVWIFALVIEAFAPTFGAWKSRDQAMKVVCYSFIVAWLAQGLIIIPYIGWMLSIVGLYGLYIYWVGLPPMMRTPPDKAIPYVLVTLAVGIVATAVLAGILGFMLRIVTPLPTYGSAGAVTLGSISDGKGNSVNLDQLAAAGQQMAANAERAQQNASNGNATLADAATLQALLPDSIAGFTRGAVESSSGNAGGIGASTAKGTYTLGDQSFELSISDVGALGGLASMAGALNVNSNKTTATGYERVTTTNGQMVEENWDNSDHRGKYSTVVANRFAISAEGNAPSIDPLKAAVGAVDQGRLSSMAR